MRNCEKILPCLIICLILTISCIGQSDSLSEKGFYIPKNIKECNQQLDKTLSKRAKDKLRLVDESRLDKVNGFFIISEWFDHDSTRLANYFKQFSITDWQERDLVIILSYHRQLNSKPFDIVTECKRLTDKRDSLNLVREAQHKINIISDSIDGVYIPTDLYDCFTQLDKLLNDTIKQGIKSKTNEIELSEYHFGLGMSMRNNWGLWGGSRLQIYFTNRNVTHPDGMSSIILSGYNQYLNGQTIDADKLINEERIRQEEFMKNVVVSTIKFDAEDCYTKEYKEFLKTRKIKDIDVYDW